MKTTLPKIFILLALTFCLQGLNHQLTTSSLILDQDHKTNKAKASEVNNDPIKKPIQNLSQNSQFSNQYSFLRNSTIKDKFFKIKEIHPVSSQYVSIVSQHSESSQNTTISSFSGSQFESKISQTSISPEQSAKFSSKKIFVNDKKSISEHFSKPVNLKMNSNYTNYKTITKNGFLYYDFTAHADLGTCKSLWRVNLDTGKEELVQYESKSCKSEIGFVAYPLIVDIGGKHMIYARGFNKTGPVGIYVIDTQTGKSLYELKSQLKIVSITYRTNIEHVYDAKTNQSKLIFVSDPSPGSTPFIETFIFNHTIQKYESVSYVCSTYLSTDFTVNGFDSGVSYDFGELYNFNKLSQVVLYKSDALKPTDNDKVFLAKEFILTTSNQSCILMLDPALNKLQVYNIDQNAPNYHTLLVLENQIGGKHISSVLTSDDKLLFVSVSLSQTKNVLKIYNFNDQSLIAEINQNPEDNFLSFAVFSTTYDRFVTLIKRETVTQQNTVTYTHHLQIRKISDPSKVIKQEPLTFLDTQASFGFVIRTDKSPKLKFLISSKSQQSISQSDKSKTYYCSIENDNFSLINSGSDFLSFSSTYFASKYIISYPHIQQNAQNHIYFYSLEDMSLINAVPYASPDSVYWKQTDFKNDTFFVYSGYLHRLDLNGLTDTANFGKTTLLLLSERQVNKRFIFLKKLGLILSYNFEQGTESEHYKVIYSASLPIENPIKPVPDAMDINMYTAYLPKYRNSNLKCDKFLFRMNAEPSSFNSFKNCQPYDPPTKYELKKQTDIDIRFSKLWKASTNHHILVWSWFNQSKMERIQVRSVNHDFQVISETQNLFEDNPVEKVDFNDEGLLIFSRDDLTVSALSPSIVNLPETYEVESFIIFAVNDLGSIAFVGLNVLSTPERPIITITVVDKNKLTLYNRNIFYNEKIPFTLQTVKAVAIDQQNSKIVFCYQTDPQNITFLAWEFVSPFDRILDMELPGKNLTKLQFVNKDKILYELDGKLQFANMTRSFKPISFGLRSQLLYAVNKDGTMFAYLYPQKLEVYSYDKDFSFLTSIELKNNGSQIEAMNFGPNNSLFLIDNNSTVTIFLNENCAHGYTNDKGYCKCLRQYAEPKNSCKCFERFTDQADGNCACLSPFVLNENGCDCAQGFYAYYSSCQECSFWCSECRDLSTSCTKYSGAFYGIVIGGSIALIVIMVAGVLLVKKFRKGKSQEPKQKANEKVYNAQKSGSDLLDENTLSKPLKSEKKSEFYSFQN